MYSFLLSAIHHVESPFSPVLAAQPDAHIPVPSSTSCLDQCASCSESAQPVLGYLPPDRPVRNLPALAAANLRLCKDRISLLVHLRERAAEPAPRCGETKTQLVRDHYVRCRFQDRHPKAKIRQREKETRKYRSNRATYLNTSAASP